MDYHSILKETLNLLYWTMLAATTVGPGTVVSCARAGAEYKLDLIWALSFGSILAYTLQEGTARLTIVSGRSLGECLQSRYPGGRKVWKIGILCWTVVILLYIGNTLLQVNCFAGGMAAIYALPPTSNTLLLRVLCCAAYTIIVITILLADKVNTLGIGLGIVTVSMVILFLILVIKLGLDMGRFAKGLLPISMPSGSANIILSLISTTALGFNLFLGGEMAKGKPLGPTQRGIAFSTFMAFFISVLILIVGDGTHEQSKGKFTIASLSAIIGHLTGHVGIWVFGIGFIAAALSSMLTVPLAAAMTAESILTIQDNQSQHDMHAVDCVLENGNTLIDKVIPSNGIKEQQQVAHTPSVPYRPFPKKYSNIMMCAMVVISAIVIASNVPTVLVILVAQVLNGCLLPFFSTCLLICINDPQFMGKRPQKGWSNCCLIFMVYVAYFITSTTIVQNLLGWMTTKKYASESTFQLWNFISSAIVSFAIMAMLFYLTELGSNVKKSFSIFFRRRNVIETVPVSDANIVS